MTKKVLILSSSPRTDGNSILMAQSALEGVQQAGNDGELLLLSDFMEGMLRDCRKCRLSDGECSIDDDYRNLLMNHVLPADGWIFATPIYWYGMSGHLKTFLDRTFCYVAQSFPESDRVVDGLMRKRVGAVVSCEESYPGVTLPVTEHLQELCTYLKSGFVGVAVGVGNKRGEVASDPNGPLQEAQRLGRNLFSARVTDYHLDTPRGGRVWSQ